MPLHRKKEKDAIKNMLVKTQTLTDLIFYLVSTIILLLSRYGDSCHSDLTWS